MEKENTSVQYRNNNILKKIILFNFMVRITQ